jgi:FAD/FMN-containing dehydrogenase
VAFTFIYVAEPVAHSAAHPNGSSIMLLGGFGFLSRLYGLSVDNLVEVEMVLADGKIVIINEYEHPGLSVYYQLECHGSPLRTDLWWAIRGAGPAFGIATRYKAKAFPVPVVFAGNLL